MREGVRKFSYATNKESGLSPETLVRAGGECRHSPRMGRKTFYFGKLALGFPEIFMKSFSFSRFSLGSVLLALMLVCPLVFTLTGCPEPETEYVDHYIDPLIGTWISSYNEKYTISETELKIENGIEGNNLFIKRIDSSSGYIYIQYTKFITGYEKEGENYTPKFATSKEESEYIGQWYALYYSALTDSSIKISQAHKEAGAQGKETLDEAVKEFTVESGYFSSSSEFQKQ